MADHDKGVVQIGPLPGSGVAGHGATITRKGDTVHIRVYGAGVYYTRLPNAEVAQEVARVIEMGLASE